MEKENYREDTRQLINSLALALTQIEMTFQESDDRVCEVFEAISDVSEAADALRAGDVDVNALAGKLDVEVKKAVQSLQFYDRLSQRVSHIEENIRSVIAIMESPDEDHTKLWEKLQGRLRSVYSTEQEQALFCAFSGNKNGQSDDTAEQGKSSGSGDIELF